MEAYKRWWKENTYSEICGHEWHNGAELAWRAALEWVLEQREMGHCVTKRHVIPVDVIEKELEDK